MTIKPRLELSLLLRKRWFTLALMPRHWAAGFVRGEGLYLLSLGPFSIEYFSHEAFL